MNISNFDRKALENCTFMICIKLNNGRQVLILAAGPKVSYYTLQWKYMKRTGGANWRNGNNMDQNYTRQYLIMIFPICLYLYVLFVYTDPNTINL